MSDSLSQQVTQHLVEEITRAAARAVDVRTVKLGTLHPGQWSIVDNATRFNVLSCGRRWGKTVLDEDLAADVMLDGGQVGYFAPTYKLLEDYWTNICNVLAPACAGIPNQKQHRLTLVNGGILECWTLQDGDAGRSKHYNRVIVDEAGLVPNLETMFSENIRPTLADFKGDLWMNGTPKGRNGFYTFHSRGRDRARWPEWSSWILPTSNNPFIDDDEIEAMRGEMTERAFKQEIMAEFLDDGGAVFRFVEQLSVLTVETEPVKGHEYCMGIDWGRSGDFTVVCIIDATTGRQVWLERFRGNFELQKPRVVGLLKFWKPTVAYAESNAAGAPMIDWLQAEGFGVIPFFSSNQSKSLIVDALALAFELSMEALGAGKLADLLLLNDADQKFELMAYEGNALPSGLIRYAAPDGENNHDDTVIALGLAWHGAKGFRPEREKTVVDETAQERFRRMRRAVRGGQVLIAQT